MTNWPIRGAKVYIPSTGRGLDAQSSIVSVAKLKGCVYRVKAGYFRMSDFFFFFANQTWLPDTLCPNGFPEEWIV